MSMLPLDKFPIRHKNRAFGDPELMDQKSIVLSLNRNGWTARVIHHDLMDTLREEAIAYSTVTKYLREAQISLGDPTPSSDATSPHIDDSGEVILRAIEELPLSSVRQLS
jgi:hypothetical protein